MVRAIHFVLPQGSEILDLAVLLAMAKFCWPCCLSAPGEGEGVSPGFCCVLAFLRLVLCLLVFLILLTGLVTADPVIAFDLSAAAGPGPVAAVGSVVVAFFLFVAGSVVAVCPVYLCLFCSFFCWRRRGRGGLILFLVF